MTKDLYFIKKHQGKERAYADALSKIDRYKRTLTPFTKLKFALFDTVNGKDGVGWHVALRSYIGQHKTPVFMYPHAARPMIQWDGLYDVWPNTAASFVISDGHKKVMEAYGYPCPIEVTGWTYCELQPFQPAKEIKNILFAPIHPNGNGWLSKVDKEINAQAYGKLIEVSKELGAKLHVRHVQPLVNNNLSAVPGVNYIQGNLDGSTVDIDQADIVVSTQTFAWLAIAKGKPTVMMREDIPPRAGNSNANFAYVKSWDKYADLLMYPYDLFDGNPADVILKAGRKEASDWRKRFLSKQFDPQIFIAKLEVYLP